jgi:hypothetical protein
MNRILFLLVLLVAMPAWAGSKHHNAEIKNDVSIDVNNRPEARSESRSESRSDSDVEIGDTKTGDLSTVYEASKADNFPGAPASVYTDACGSGVSISAPGGGGTLGSNEAVCLYIALAQAANTMGMVVVAEDHMLEAGRLLHRRTLFTRIPPFKWLHFDAWPVVGGFFR